MLYALIGKDKPDSLALRMATREAHLKYLHGQAKAVITGPLLSNDEESMNGSLMVIDVANRTEAEVYVANDPYTLAGLFETMEIIAWKRLI